MTLREGTIKRVNQALHECLDECYSSASPLAALASYLGRLRRNPLWEKSEIEEFEALARHMLKALVTPVERTPSQMPDRGRPFRQGPRDSSHIGERSDRRVAYGAPSGQSASPIERAQADR